MRFDIKSILQLSKYSISLAVGISAFTGFVLSKGELSWDGLIPLWGIFFLAASASVLNQIQEKDSDAKMDRTSNRPLPMGKINERQSWFLMGLFFIVGTFLMIQTTIEGLFWGWAGLAWYNFVYTPLKRKSAFSVFPGAFVGAIPPVAGWMAAGGDIIDHRLHFLAMFFFLGQMPHFWLLITKYGDDYKKGGFPTPFDYFSHIQIKRVNSTWLISTFVAAIFLPFINVLNDFSTSALLIISSVYMIIWSIKAFWSQSTLKNYSKNIRNLFLGFNYYYLLVMTLLTLDQINF